MPFNNIHNHFRPEENVTNQQTCVKCTGPVTFYTLVKALTNCYLNCSNQLLKSLKEGHTRFICDTSCILLGSEWCAEGCGLNSV